MIVTLLVIITFSYIAFFSNAFKLPNFEPWKTQLLGVDGLTEGDSLFFTENEKNYIDIEAARKNLKLDILWDKTSKVAVFYDGRDIYRFYTDGRISKNGSTIEHETDSLVQMNNKAYIHLDRLLEKSTLDYYLIKSLNRLVYLDTALHEESFNAPQDYRVRKSDKLLAEVVDVVKEGETYFKLETQNDWQKIMTSRGTIGYISENKITQKGLLSDLIGNIKDLEVPEGLKSLREKTQVVAYEKYQANKLLNLTWNQFTTKTPNSSKLTAPTGLDVIIPTWFSLKEDMTLKDIGTYDYMYWAKSNGYDVWILMSNSFSQKLTSELVNSAKNRESVIKSLVDKTKAYGAKGINIDFEDINIKDKDMLTQFMKELYATCKANNLILSMDVTFKSNSENWSLCYDRPELAKFTDYMIVMAYDQHTAGGGVAGPVSSIAWVDRGIENFLSEVPHEQVILGVPYYTRLWQIDENGKAKSTVYSMDKIQEKLKQEKVNISYDEKEGLNYAEYIKSGLQYKVWIEDEVSIRNRIEIIRKNELAGIASWKKGFENANIWSIIYKSIR